MQFDPAPWWLPGGHLQTIWPAFYSKPVAQAATPAETVKYTRQRWSSPDGDFIDVDFSDSAAAPERPRLVLFHGLEGSSQSHYARAFSYWAKEQGLAYAVPHFRGCSGSLNLAPRAYHSGDYEEIDWILQRMRAYDVQAGQPRTLIAVGISLGGNAIMRWAQERGASAANIASAVASVCSPLDLNASGRHISRGLNRYLYTPMFLRSMKPKALQYLAQHPGLFDCKKMLASRDLYEFDNVFTAPLHGFKNTLDYWLRASAQPHLSKIQIPALVVNSQNDPFIPASSLPQFGQVGCNVSIFQPEFGGHVGFASGPWPGHLQSMPNTVGKWLLRHI